LKKEKMLKVIILGVKNMIKVIFELDKINALKLLAQNDDD